jgi:hypothetical protein
MADGAGARSKSIMFNEYDLDQLKDYADQIEDSPRSTPTRKVEGRRKTARVVAYALFEMSLDEDEAIRLIFDWNDSLDWSWDEDELTSLIGWVKAKHNPFF